jgi:hypothetical protein
MGAVKSVSCWRVWSKGRTGGEGNSRWELLRYPGFLFCFVHFNGVQWEEMCSIYLIWGSRFPMLHALNNLPVFLFFFFWAFRTPLMCPQWPNFNWRWSPILHLTKINGMASLMTTDLPATPRNTMEASHEIFYCKSRGRKGRWRRRFSSICPTLPRTVIETVIEEIILESWLWMSSVLYRIVAQRTHCACHQYIY